ncbi:hypothetical protein Nepgr_033627 [Nepenthes gracilis]|uniref:Uncharacterized protein n=1 Tax=Nepenthes gracilis TaxID=150966 RepID=A0AAD3Y731_NEPGR|nr:hypothetical protein Nepgr_033627 [Nepenthes gracilis]
MLGEFALLASVDPLQFASGSWRSCLARMLQWAVFYNEFHAPPVMFFLDPGLNADDAVVVWAWLPSS